MSATLTRLPDIGLRMASVLRCLRTVRLPFGETPSTISRRDYSTRQSSTDRRSKTQQSQNEPPRMVPKVNLREMFQGASPMTKGIVYTMITVMATAETYTYGIWIWRKMYPPLPPQEEEGGG